MRAKTRAIEKRTPARLAGMSGGLLQLKVPLQPDKVLYAADQLHPILEVASTSYSNLVFVSIGPFDVWLDFAQMPGLPREGKTYLQSHRVYLSRRAAKKLADDLLASLSAVSASAAEGGATDTADSKTE